MIVGITTKYTQIEQPDELTRIETVAIENISALKNTGASPPPATTKTPMPKPRQLASSATRLSRRLPARRFWPICPLWASAEACR